MASMSEVGKMGAMLRRVAMAARYRGRMRRLLSTLFRALLVIAVLAVVRAVLLDRAPQREIPASGRRAGDRQPRHLAGRAPQARVLRTAASE